MPRPVLEHAISVYFQYVYGLVPIVHKPSFLADFHSHREELPGEEEWTALVLSVAGLTMAQVPWAFGPMTKEVVRRLVQSCYTRAKAFLFVDFDRPTIWRCEWVYSGGERCDPADSRRSSLHVRLDAGRLTPGESSWRLVSATGGIERCFSERIGA